MTGMVLWISRDEIMNCQAGNDHGIGKEASGAGTEMGLRVRGIFLLLIAQTEAAAVVQNEINTEHMCSPELIFFFSFLLIQEIFLVMQ